MKVFVIFLLNMLMMEIKVNLYYKNEYNNKIEFF